MRPLRRLCGTATLAVQAWGQARYPFLPAARVAQDRDRRVRRMMAYAGQQVPFYRRALQQAGLRIGDVRTAADLAALPLIDASTIRADPDAFLGTARARRNSLTLRTSGSSGVSRVVPIDRAALFRNAAHGERERCLLAAAVGRRYGYREAVIVFDPSLEESSTPLVQGFLREHAWLPGGMAIERIYLDSTEAPASWVPRLKAFRPHVIQGYGSSIDALVAHVAATGADLHRPRAVYFHSDGVSEATRRALDTLGIPVFSTYEACEALKMGFECGAHQGYHINIDTYPIRLVDREGRDVPEGDTGRVVVSNLSNRAMVLLNYDLGDRARWLPGACVCGRSLPRLELVEGATIPIVVLPSGRTVNPSEIYRMCRGLAAVWEYQIVQLAPDRFRILLVVPDASARPVCTAAVGRAFADLFGREAQVDIVCVDRIPLTPGGKKRSFVPLDET